MLITSSHRFSWFFKDNLNNIHRALQQVTIYNNIISISIVCGDREINSHGGLSYYYYLMWHGVVPVGE